MRTPEAKRALKALAALHAPYLDARASTRRSLARAGCIRFVRAETLSLMRNILVSFPVTENLRDGCSSAFHQGSTA
jgi:hypothetical protein